MVCFLRNIVIKGRKEDINSALNSFPMASVEDIEVLANGLCVYRVWMGDLSINGDLNDFPFVNNDKLKCLMLVNVRGAFGDEVLFKSFKSSQIKKQFAFYPNWISTYKEELEGQPVPYMDRYFDFDMYSYSEGDVYRVRNSMAFADEWDDDTNYVRVEELVNENN